ncbi:MAG: Coenzyme F420 hydrogenase/dehydrogenase, beta subunit C-terminal domain [Clostridia bacterium]|nr:Coenzyme F420 hydrogenase/dehydrogenase, beta subunit C-terminal domain [Clostridia bacterium]
MIREYIQAHTCTGCGACVNACGAGALAFFEDEHGFWTPALTGTCTGCGACLKACPLYDPPVPHTGTVAYAAFSRDEAIREQSSSGGVFSLLAQTVLASGGAVYGAAYDEDFTVRHIGVEEPADLAKLRGAKYTQSRIGDLYAQIKKKLAAGQTVLFSGTPCQTAGLSSFLGRDDDRLLLIDTVCHSVPSPLAWRRYVEYRARQDADGTPPASVNMRSKQTGWSRYRYACRFSYPDGREYAALGSDDLFMRLFIRGCISRSSCADCRFKGYDRVSDITLGDCWGIWEISPDMDDDRGTSLLLVHSEKGERALQSIRDQLTMKPLSLSDASRQNPAILRSAAPDQHRMHVLDEVCRGRYDLAAKALDRKPSLLRRLKQKLKP